MVEPKLGKRIKLKHLDSNPCKACSHCCEYVSLEFDKPTTVSDFDTIIWFLVHRHVNVFIDEDNDWYIQFNQKCDKLKNGICSYYNERPKFCRDYEVDQCSRYGEGETEKHLFKNEQDLYAYLSKKRPAMFKKLKAQNHIQFKKGVEG